jgi:hypothetical protein
VQSRFWLSLSAATISSLRSTVELLHAFDTTSKPLLLRIVAGPTSAAPSREATTACAQLAAALIHTLQAGPALAGELEARLRRQVEQLLETALAVGEQRSGGCFYAAAFDVAAAVGGVTAIFMLVPDAAAALAGELVARLRRQVEQLLETALAVGEQSVLMCYGCQRCGGIGCWVEICLLSVRCSGAAACRRAGGAAAATGRAVVGDGARCR